MSHSSTKHTLCVRTFPFPTLVCRWCWKVCEWCLAYTLNIQGRFLKHLVRWCTPLRRTGHVRSDAVAKKAMVSVVLYERKSTRQAWLFAGFHLSATLFTGFHFSSIKLYCFISIFIQACVHLHLQLALSLDIPHVPCAWGSSSRGGLGMRVIKFAVYNWHICGLTAQERNACTSQKFYDSYI